LTDEDVRKWLSPPDPWKNHHIARTSHHKGTAAWFADGDIFSEWKKSGPKFPFMDSWET
jgi:hypothetical protein